jgi:hypothetical protein
VLLNRTTALFLMLGCDAGSPRRCETEPEVKILNPTCASQDSHTANASASIHFGRAMLELLQSRDCARRVGRGSDALETQIRGLLAIACGFDSTESGLHRRAIMDGATLDELFPQAGAETALSASCGVIFHRDGQISRGKDVDWDH